MTISKHDSIVSFHYKNSCEGEFFFNSAKDRDEPLKVKIGSGQVMPELEQALIGMKEGEEKKVVVPPENAYGLYREEMIVVVDKSELPDGITPVKGMMIQGLSVGDSMINVYISDVNGDKVTLDANHRFAGKHIDFELELLTIHE